LKAEKELLTPAILRVSKQIYAEALPILYNQELVFVNALALHCFLAQIGNDAVKSIQHVTIQSLKCGKLSEITHPAFTALANATNLNVLNILYKNLQSSDRLFTDIAVDKPAQWLFPVAHVWFEQMEKNKARGGKDWRNVFAWIKGSFIGSTWGPRIKFSGERFCADIEKLLKA
jgi:hypothetical protein